MEISMEFLTKLKIRILLVSGCMEAVLQSLAGFFVRKSIYGYQLPC
jgi:hypothetical protein